MRRTLDSSSTLSAGGKTFHAGRDFVATSASPRSPTGIRGLPIVFGGTQNDTINPVTVERVRGKVLVVKARGGRLRPRRPRRQRARRADPVMLQLRAAADSAAAIVLVEGDSLPAFAVNNAMNTKTARPFSPASDAAPAPLTITVTKSVAEAILGVSPDAAAKGQAGKSLSATLHFHDQTLPAAQRRRHRSRQRPKAQGRVRRDRRAQRSRRLHARRSITIRFASSTASCAPAARTIAHAGDAPSSMARDHAQILDSLRRRTRSARLDSIYNGADDDGSGSVTRARDRRGVRDAARRSRSGRCSSSGTPARRRGSRLASTSPTTRPCRATRSSRSSTWTWSAGASEGRHGTIAGRGRRPGLPPAHRLAPPVDGARRHRRDGEQDRARRRSSSTISIDANGHPQQIYCRSDHYEYARYGIPITFFSTGGHTRLPPGDRRAAVHRLRPSGARRPTGARHRGARWRTSTTARWSIIR